MIALFAARSRVSVLPSEARCAGSAAETAGKQHVPACAAHAAVPPTSPSPPVVLVLLDVQGL